MEKVKLTCKACNKETERKPKEEPKTPKEKKQIYFICPSCGAKNLRDGTAIYKKDPKEPAGPPQEPERKPTDDKAKDKKEPPEEGPEKSSGFTFFG
jgi:NAD-dependent SIR2 family protein deacetylase